MWSSDNEQIPLEVHRKVTIVLAFERTKVRARLGNVVAEPEHAKRLIQKRILPGVSAIGREMKELLSRIVRSWNFCANYSPCSNDRVCRETSHNASFYIERVATPNDKKLSDGWSVAPPLPVCSAGLSQRT
jgi:hypothetical protein